MKIEKKIIEKVATGKGSEKKEAIEKIKNFLDGKINFQSTFPLYKKIAKGELAGFIVPAFNIRVLTYDVASALFRAAKKEKAEAFIIELARSEIKYTDQSPEEYSAIIASAAYNEGYRGPIFLQGDHFRIDRGKYFSDKKSREKELADLKKLIKKSIRAGFLNIDIDGSFLLIYKAKDLEKRLFYNAKETADLTAFIRMLKFGGITVSVGGEVGEIGGKNTSAEELKTFLDLHNRELKKRGVKEGIIKVAIQTGTSHGGVVLPSGKLKKVNEDYKSLVRLSKLAKRYGLAGAVQHGASTLPDSYFAKFKKTGACEIHLATGLQNIILDSEYFPANLRNKIYKEILKNYKKEEGTEKQFIYRKRKLMLGKFKKDIWNISKDKRDKISAELEKRFIFFFKKFGVSNSTEIVNKTYNKN